MLYAKVTLRSRYVLGERKVLLNPEQPMLQLPGCLGLPIWLHVAANESNSRTRTPRTTSYARSAGWHCRRGHLPRTGPSNAGRQGWETLSCRLG